MLARGSLGERRASSPATREDVLLLLLVLVLTTGCITGRQNPAATQPATAIDPKTAQTAYWMAKPAIAEVSSSNFDRLWAAAQDSIRDHSFLIDRTDYREGILTTQPRFPNCSMSSGAMTLSIRTISRKAHWEPCAHRANRCPKGR